MAFCIQCGEEIGLETEKCPACGRLVGASSIGQALERRPSAAKTDVLRVVAIAVLALVLGTAVFVWRARGPALGNDELLDATRRAAPHLVRLRPSTGDSADSGGVVVARTADGPLVVAPVGVGKPGSRVTVSAGESRWDGIVLLAGADRTSAGLALVLVPGCSLAPAPAALEVSVDEPVLALNANASLATAGRVLSHDEDGLFVHDAPLTAEARGYGLFDRNGALAGWPAADPASGESLALGVRSLLARLVVQEAKLPAGSSWVEPSLPMPSGAVVAFIVQGGGERDGVVRFGKGPERRARAIQGHRFISGQPAGDGPLQLGRAPGAPADAVLRFTIVSWVKASAP